MAELSCRQAELLEADVEMARASESQRMRVEVHLQHCESCAARAERLRLLSSALRDEPVEARVPDRSIVARALMEASSKDEARDRRGKLSPILAAAVLLLGMAGGLLWTLGSGGPGEAPVADGERGPSDPAVAPREAPEDRPATARTTRLLAGLGTPCPGVTSETTPDAHAWVANAVGDVCRLGLDAGELRLFVDPEAGLQVVVETPSAAVQVVGTVFSVGVEDGFTEVVVYRGTVEVSRDEATLRVTGGHRLGIGPETATASVEAAEERALQPLVRLVGEADRPHVAVVPADDHLAEGDWSARSPGTAATRPAPSEGPRHDRAVGEGGGESTGSATAEPPGPTADEAPAEPPPDEESVAPVGDLRRLLQEGQPAEARAQARDRSRRPEYSRRRAELLTVIAESYVMERDWRKAFDSYRRVWSGSPGTATAANALIAGANLALDRLADPAEAVRLYESYLRQYPRGALHETALIGRCRALSVAGRTRDASACARAYLATHPQGRFRDRATWLLQ